VTPEAADGGEIAKSRRRPHPRRRANGRLEVLVDPNVWATRTCETYDLATRMSG